MSRKLPKISDVLFTAANKHLAVDYNDYLNNRDVDKDYYSCCAVNAVINEMEDDVRRRVSYIYEAERYEREIIRMEKLKERIHKFLCSLGVDCDRSDQFREFEKLELTEAYDGEVLEEEWEPTKKSQGARYLWLMFAYMIALEEGK
jgi:hypothetical protein